MKKLLLATALLFGVSSQLPVQAANAATVTYKSVQYFKVTEYKTSFRGSSSNRVSNIKLAAKKVSGIVLKPGQEFSFHKTVGNSNIAKDGWKKATVIENGKHSTGYGGGICQVSSTLYNAVNAAKHKIIEIHHHSLSVGYVPKGKDATVAWGSKDFKFKNTSSKSIMIQIVPSGTQLIVKVFKAL